MTNLSKKDIKINCAYTKLISLNEIKENPRNTNKHPEKQIQLLAKNILFQGVRRPIIVSTLTKTIVSGHARLMAAKTLEMNTFPVDYQDFDSLEQEYAFLESDNKIAELSEWDHDKFELNLDELNLNFNFDKELFGTLNVDIFNLNKDELDDVGDNDNKEHVYKIELTFDDELEARDLYDDLLSKGHLPKMLKMK